jgi:mono/diheme cytochrome c family protein
MRAGQAIYEDNCAACHAAEGTGIPQTVLRAEGQFFCAGGRSHQRDPRDFAGSAERGEARRRIAELQIHSSQE